MRGCLIICLLVVWQPWLLSQMVDKGAVRASAPLRLDLRTVLELGGAQNLTIQAFEQQQALAFADHAVQRAWWLPEVRMGTALHQLWGNAMNSDGFIFQNVKRQTVWAGLQVGAQWEVGAGPFLTKAAAYRVKATVYETAAVRNQTLLNIVEVYYDLLLAQFSAQACAHLQQQAAEVAAQLSVQASAGLQLPSAMLLAQSNAKQLEVQLLAARRRYQQHATALSTLLQLPPGQVLRPIDTVLVPVPWADGGVDVGARGPDQSTAPDTGTGRPSGLYEARVGQYDPRLKHLEWQLKALQMERKSTTIGPWLPTLQVGTSGSYFGGIWSPIAPTGSIDAALLWRLPLGRVFYRGAVQQYDARMALQENQLRQMKVEINGALQVAERDVALTAQQISLSKESTELALVALEQLLERQQLAVVSPLALLQAQEVYIKTRLDYLSAVTDYNKAHHALFVAKGGQY